VHFSRGTTQGFELRGASVTRTRPWELHDTVQIVKVHSVRNQSVAAASEQFDREMGLDFFCIGK
jgi:hypothetical protein